MNIYSVRLRPVSAKEWTKRGIRVEAESPSEASDKAIALKGITEPCLACTTFIKEIKPPKQVIKFF